MRIAASRERKLAPCSGVQGYSQTTISRLLSAVAQYHTVGSRLGWSGQKCCRGSPPSLASQAERLAKENDRIDGWQEKKKKTHHRFRPCQTPRLGRGQTGQRCPYSLHLMPRRGTSQQKRCPRRTKQPGGADISVSGASASLSRPEPHHRVQTRPPTHHSAA